MTGSSRAASRCRRSSTSTPPRAARTWPGYLTPEPWFSAFALEDGVVYRTYQTGWRGLEFLMGYYPILDRAPKGRDEDDGFQLWIRRHDEYASP